jgi:hypothetical protein
MLQTEETKCERTEFFARVEERASYSRISQPGLIYSGKEMVDNLSVMRASSTERGAAGAQGLRDC